MAVAACGACRGNYGRGGTCGTSERVRPWWRMWVARIDQPPGTCISSPASDLIPLNSAPPPLVADCELIPDACQCEGGAVARCTGGPSAKCGRMRRSALGFSHSWLRKYSYASHLSHICIILVTHMHHPRGAGQHRVTRVCCGEVQGLPGAARCRPGRRGGGSTVSALHCMGEVHIGGTLSSLHNFGSPGA